MARRDSQTRFWEEDNKTKITMTKSPWTQNDHNLTQEEMMYTGLQDVAQWYKPVLLISIPSYHWRGVLELIALEYDTWYARVHSEVKFYKREKITE